MNISQTREALEILYDLEYQFDNNAIVSCTPCLDATPVLPTQEVPYADHMEWFWSIEFSCKVNMAYVVAKIPHRFKMHVRRLRKGDVLTWDLYARDLDHGH